MKAEEVSRRDVINLLDDITARGSPVSANRTLALVSAVYRWALAEDLLDTTPTLGIRPRIIEVPRNRILDADEIRQFWKGLEAAAMTESVKDILRLCLVTGQRVSEVAGAQLIEMDLGNSIWDLPGARTKNKRPNRVPLSSMAIEIIERNLGESECLFPSPTSTGHIGPKAPMRALSRNRKHFDMEHFTAHDLRRSAASGMASIGIDRTTISAVLNHASADRSVTGQVYDRYSYEAEKRNALERWARRLTEIIEGKEPEKVVILRGGQ